MDHGTPRGFGLYWRTTPRELWSRTIEGNHAKVFLHRRTGRAVVSTLRREENEPEERGFDSFSVISGRSRSFTNLYPQKCCAFEPDGTLAWEFDDRAVVDIDVDGSVALGASREDGFLLDDDGRLMQVRAPKKRYWQIVSPQGEETSGEPRLQPPGGVADGDEQGIAMGAVRVGTHVYWLHGNVFQQYRTDGALLSRVVIPDGARRVKWPESDDLYSAPKDLIPLMEQMTINPKDWMLTYDPGESCLLATSLGRPAWLMGLGLDGTVRWVELLGKECCNELMLLNETLRLHVSSCGHRLTFLRRDEKVFRICDFPNAIGRVFRHGEQALGVVVHAHGLRILDMGGNAKWALQDSGIEDAVGNGWLVYVLSGAWRGPFTLKAFETRRR